MSPGQSLLGSLLGPQGNRETVIGAAGFEFMVQLLGRTHMRQKHLGLLPLSQRPESNDVTSSCVEAGKGRPESARFCRCWKHGVLWPQEKWGPGSSVSIPLPRVSSLICSSSSLPWGRVWLSTGNRKWTPGGTFPRGIQSPASSF